MENEIHVLDYQSNFKRSKVLELKKFLKDIFIPIESFYVDENDSLVARLGYEKEPIGFDHGYVAGIVFAWKFLR